MAVFRIRYIGCAHTFAEWSVPGRSPSCRSQYDVPSTLHTMELAFQSTEYTWKWEEKSAGTPGKRPEKLYGAQRRAGVEPPREPALASLDQDRCETLLCGAA